MEYQDMVIEAFNAERKLGPNKVWRVSFKVRALSPKGEMSVDQAVPVKYTEGELQAELQKLDTRQLPRSSLIALGRTLAALLLPPGPKGAEVSLRELLKINLAALGPEQGLRLRLRLPALLAPLPWEYLYVDRAGGGGGIDGFLALDPRVAIVRYETLDAPTDLKPIVGNIKVVAALASSDAADELDLAKEEANLKRVFKGRTGIVPRYLPKATLDEVLAAIPNTGIFHFAGHGSFERKPSDTPGVPAGEGSLIFYDQPVYAEQLAVNLRGNGIRLAVLGGCLTSRTEWVSVWSGVAPALVKAEIPAVVGNQFKIKDECAIAFSGQFYQALVGGLPIERAVCAGRIAAYNADQGGRDWGAPVLYLRAGDGQLFAGATDKAVREKARKAAEADISVRVKEVAKGGEVLGANVRDMLGGKLAVTVDVDGTVYGRVVGADIDELKGGHAEVNVEADVVTGSLIGADIGEMGGGGASIEEEIGTVEEGGSLIGLHLDGWGGGGAPGRKKGQSDRRPVVHPARKAGATSTDKPRGGNKRGGWTKVDQHVASVHDGGAVAGEVKGDHAAIGGQHGIEGGVRFESGGQVIIYQGGSGQPQEPATRASTIPLAEDLIEEPIRLDVAAPQTAAVEEPFDVAVAVLQPDAPPLKLEDLTLAASEEGRLFRTKKDEVVTYQVEVTAQGCDVTPAHYILKLRPNESAKPCWFQVTAHKTGRRTLMVNAYQQKEGELVAQTIVHIAITVPVAPGGTP